MSDSMTTREPGRRSTGSRVSWGPVFAGAVIALALYFLLTLVGSAVGLSVSDGARPATVGVWAAVWAIVSTVVALFVGGWITSQLIVGENKVEAATHGVILWGVVFAMLLWLMASGVKSGFNAMVGMAQAGGAAAQGTPAEDWQAAARRSGVPQESIDEWRRKAADAESQQAAAIVTWWAVLGTILSMAAAVAGALVGAGPTFRLVELGGRPRHPAFARQEHAARQ